MASRHVLRGQMSSPIEGTQQAAASNTNGREARQVTVVLAIQFHLNSTCPPKQQPHFVRPL